MVKYSGLRAAFLITLTDKSSSKFERRKHWFRQINISEKIEKLTANYLPTGIWNYSISSAQNEFNLPKEPTRESKFYCHPISAEAKPALVLRPAMPAQTEVTTIPSRHAGTPPPNIRPLPISPHPKPNPIPIPAHPRESCDFLATPKTPY